MFGTVNFKSVLAFGECLICHDEMLGKPALAHEGKCEPCHEECIKTWVKLKNICPKCHATVNVNSLFSWKERAIIKLNLMKTDALCGAIMGTYGLINNAIIMTFLYAVPATARTEIAVLGAALGTMATTGAMAIAMKAVVIARAERARVVDETLAVVIPSLIVGASVALGAALTNPEIIKTVGAATTTAVVMGIITRCCTKK